MLDIVGTQCHRKEMISAQKDKIEKHRVKPENGPPKPYNQPYSLAAGLLDGILATGKSKRCDTWVTG